MFEDKNNKKTAVAAELFELSSCPYGLAPESQLSRQPQVQYGFVPKLSRPSGKNIVSLRFTKKSCALLNMFFGSFPRFSAQFFCPNQIYRYFCGMKVRKWIIIKSTDKQKGTLILLSHTYKN